MTWIPGDDGQRDERREKAIDDHRNYWAEHGTPNIDCFGPGFDAGWKRANEFREDPRPDHLDGHEEPNHDSVQGYAESRRGEFEIPHEEEDHHWEWVHGFWQGMTAAWDCGRWEEENQEEHHEEEGGEE